MFTIMDDLGPSESVEYFDAIQKPITTPPLIKTFLSRLFLPLLAFISREKSLYLGLVPIDDERVIMAMKYAKGKVLDIGCGANNFIRSYGNGVGVDVFPWQGCDIVIKDAGELPFRGGSFDTVSLLACLNHIPNREDATKEAYRVLRKDGRVLVSMISPRWGRFIHWIRFRNDPDHKDRHIDHDHEMLGMSSKQVNDILLAAGFTGIKRKRFVFGLNNLYIGQK